MDMDICVVIPLLHGLLSHEDVLRTAGGRIDGTHGDHAADLKVRIDPVPRLHRQSAGHQLIVGCLVHDLLLVIPIPVADPGVSVDAQLTVEIGLVVDLIEGHPVGYFIFITLKTNRGEPDKEINDLPVSETAVLFCQVKGHLKMA